MQGENMDKKLSVIIPVYNTSKYIEKLLERMKSKEKE